MKALRLLALAVLVAGILGAHGAAGDGGPSPGVLFGGKGIVAPGGRFRYVALGAGKRTLIEKIRVRGGLVLRSWTIRGWYGVPLVTYDGTAGGLSGDGGTLILSSFPGSMSSFVVLRARSLRPLHRIRLRGTFSFDAVSPDGSLLYLIQYLPGSSRYLVRAYDVRAGQLLKRVVFDRRDGPRMSGVPVTRVSSRDGRWSYTLYDRPRMPFIHALDTRKIRAVCIDLGRRLGNARYRLRLRLGGRKLVLRRDGKSVAVVDTRTFRVSAS